jgi:hypothetical protein
VIVHEMGHLLGLDDLNEPPHPGAVMDDYLQPGVRRLPGRVANGAVTVSLATGVMQRTEQAVSAGLVGLLYSDVTRLVLAAAARPDSPPVSRLPSHAVSESGTQQRLFASVGTAGQQPRARRTARDRIFGELDGAVSLGDLLTSRA